MRRFRRRKQVEDADIIEGEIEEIGEAESPPPPPEPPRRRRLFSRRERRKPIIDTPLDVPLERVAPDVPTPEEARLMPYMQREEEREAKPRTRRRLRLPRLLVWSEVRPSLLLIALGLVAGGVFWTMHNRNQVSQTADDWWPLVLFGLALAWAVSALIGRRAAAFLAASALAGISLSLLMDTQDIVAWHETLVGSVLITIGIGIMARGLLLRQGSVA